MRVVLAPDKFKGTATARQLVDAMAAVVSATGGVPQSVPMADGGDGTLDAFGGANRTTTVTGPLGEPVDAAWRISGELAVIEMATASGLVLAGGAEGNDPLDASTRGTGELLMTAVGRGAKRVIVGLGGSATTDGGLGAVEAVGTPARLGGVEVMVATDVETLFLDAARVFGPQKGATAAQVAFLEARLAGVAQRYRDDFDVDVVDATGSGAAGGLGGGLLALGATIVSGFELIAEEVGLEEAIANADLVVTGEGQLDAESFAGKVVGGVADMADEHGVPVLVIAGAIAADAPALGGAVQAVSLSERFGIDRAMADPAALAAEVLSDHLT